MQAHMRRCHSISVTLSQVDSYHRPKRTEAMSDEDFIEKLKEELKENIRTEANSDDDELISPEEVKENFVKIGKEFGKDYKCKICSKQISGSIWHLRRHFVGQHFEAGLEFTCPICKDVLQTRESLKMHLKWQHSVEAPVHQMEFYMHPKQSFDFED